MHRILRRDRGFSFIELLAYMAIAALLILAAIPQFNQYRQKAVISNMRDTAHNAALAAEAANINTVAARAKQKGTILLASTRIRLAATTTTFDAIRTAVAAVKTNAGETVTVADEGSTDYLITVTSSKVAATTKVVYASTYATTDGLTVSPGQSTIVNGTVVGGSGQPTAGSTPTPTTPAGLRCNSGMSANYVGVFVSKTAIPASFPWGKTATTGQQLRVTDAVMYDKSGGVIDNTTIFSAISSYDSSDYVGFQYNYQNRFTDAQIAKFKDGGYITGTIDGKLNKLYYVCGQNGGTYQADDPAPSTGTAMPIIDAYPWPTDLTYSSGKYSGSFSGSGSPSSLVWATGNAKTFAASNVHVYANQADYTAGREIAGAATGSWTLNAKGVGGSAYAVTGSGDLSGLNAAQRAAWGSGLIIKFVDGNEYEVVSVTTPPPSEGGSGGWDEDMPQ